MPFPFFKNMTDGSRRVVAFCDDPGDHNAVERTDFQQQAFPYRSTALAQTKRAS